MCLSICKYKNTAVFGYKGLTMSKSGGDGSSLSMVDTKAMGNGYRCVIWVYKWQMLLTRSSIA